MQNLSPVSDEKDIVTKGYVDAVKSAAAINKTTLGYSGKNLFNWNVADKVQVFYTNIVNETDTEISINSKTKWSRIIYKLPTVEIGKSYILSVKISDLDESGGDTARILLSSDLSGNNLIRAVSLSSDGVYEIDFSVQENADAVYLMLCPNWSGTTYTASANSFTVSEIMLRYADITDSTYEPYVPDVNTRLLSLEDKQAQSGTLLASTSIGSSDGDITIENLSAYSSAWAYIDGNSNGIEFATNVIIPIAYLAKSTSNSVKLAGGIPSAAYTTSSGPQAPKDTSAYITAKVSGNVLSLSLSTATGVIGNVKIVAM